MSGRFDWLEVEEARPRAAAKPDEFLDAHAYLQQADLAFRRGAPEAALRLYGQCLGEDAMRWEAWLGQVLCLYELDEPEEARTWANKALERFPQCPELMAAKALVLARQGLPAPAAELADLAIAKKIPSSMVWLLRGLVLLLIEPGRGSEARCFGKALELGDPGGGISLRAGLGYLDAGEPAQARGHLERAADRDADNPLAWWALGRLFEELYALGRAASCHERALKLKPEFKDRVLDALHRIHGRTPWRRLLDRLRAWSGGR